MRGAERRSWPSTGTTAGSLDWSSCSDDRRLGPLCGVTLGAGLGTWGRRSLSVTVLERQLQHAYFQLQQQLASYSGLDTKVATVLGADAVLTGLLFTSGARLAGPGWVNLAAIGTLAISVLTGIGAMWVRRALVGPFPSSFYAKYRTAGSLQADAQLLSDLSDALKTNDDRLAWKGLAWSVSASALVVAVLLTLAVRTLPVYTGK